MRLSDGELARPRLRDLRVEPLAHAAGLRLRQPVDAEPGVNALILARRRDRSAPGSPQGSGAAAQLRNAQRDLPGGRGQPAPAAAAAAVGAVLAGHVGPHAHDCVESGFQHGPDEPMLSGAPPTIAAAACRRVPIAVLAFPIRIRFLGVVNSRREPFPFPKPGYRGSKALTPTSAYNHLLAKHP